jgi:ParB family chromosome partitioning protein
MNTEAMKNELFTESVYFIEVDKIDPNPYQPRREFDQDRLRELSDSIRQYGVLQPLVVSRIEENDEYGGVRVRYELIAGERRLRASRLAGLTQVPAVIRKEHDPMMKLELAIIENLQREDLNPVDRARAFMRLAQEFGFSHKEIGKKVGKSRVYVSNSLRILQMPQEILEAVEQKRVSEGHTRPLLMLNDKSEEQLVLFKEILYKKITVREAERLARNIAKDKARKKELLPDPETEEIENKLQDALGTRVRIVRKDKGGSISIDFFSNDDLDIIMKILKGEKDAMQNPHALMEKFESSLPQEDVAEGFANYNPNPVIIDEKDNGDDIDTIKEAGQDLDENSEFLDDSSLEETKAFENEDMSEDSEEDLYNIKHFSL